jgi:hypothetical protein
MKYTIQSVNIMLAPYVMWITLTCVLLLTLYVGCKSGKENFNPNIAIGGKSTDGNCGPNFNNTYCPDGQCCSSNGKCGGNKTQLSTVTDDFCNAYVNKFLSGCGGIACQEIGVDSYDGDFVN